MLDLTTVESIRLSDMEDEISIIYNRNTRDKYMINLPVEDVLEIVDCLGRMVNGRRAEQRMTLPNGKRITDGRQTQESKS